MLLDDIAKMQPIGYQYILDPEPAIQDLILSPQYRIDSSDEQYEWSLKCEASKRRQAPTVVDESMTEILTPRSRGATPSQPEGTEVNVSSQPTNFPPAPISLSQSTNALHNPTFTAPFPGLALANHHSSLTGSSSAPDGLDEISPESVLSPAEATTPPYDPASEEVEGNGNVYDPVHTPRRRAASHLPDHAAEGGPPRFRGPITMLPPPVMLAPPLPTPTATVQLICPVPPVRELPAKSEKKGKITIRNKMRNSLTISRSDKTKGIKRSEKRGSVDNPIPELAPAPALSDSSNRDRRGSQ